MANSALRLKSVLDFEDDNGYKRIAGDEWLFEGPGTYLPRKEVVIEGTIHATVIRPNQAIKLSARKECIDRDGNPRVTGEEWIIKKTGAYLPGPYEEVVDIVNAYVLTEKKALHMRALKTFKDDFGIVRKNGEEWLIKMTDTETHIPSVYEEVVEVVNITTLTNRQYAVILDPVDKDGKPQLGRKKLVKGESSFFLMPGERLEKGIQNILLGEDEGLVLEAIEVFKDGDAVHRPGDRWMIRGPIEYVPPVEVEVVMKRRTIPLDEDEGVYVRNIRTGKVRAVIGETYMLNQDEELWKKVLPPAVESLLREDPLAVHSLATTRKPPPRRGEAEVRDKTRVITYWVPHNAAVQIYDYKKTARVVFGPELVMLGPKEQFTQINLSGGLPKKPNQIHSLVLLLGPDFCTDIIVVETADHARLQLELSYHWHFDSKDKKNAEEAAKLFSVPDFIGVACKILASRIRNAVIAVQFDEFFKNSMKIIRSSVFDLDEHGKMCDKYIFLQNQFCITSIDMQSMEPVDQRTKVALQKSMQLAIEVTPSSQSISPHGIEQQLRVAKEAVDLPLIDINLPQGLEHLKTLTQSMLQSDEIRDLFIEMMEHAEKKFDGNLIPRQVEVVESKKLDESKQFGLCNLTAGGKTKFIINVSAILCDCVRSQPKSQQIHLLFCITVVHELCHLMLRQSFRLSKTPEHFMNKAGTRDFGALAERRLFSQIGCTYNGIDLIHECEGWLNRDVNYHSAELGSKETGRILSVSYVTDLLHSGKWHPPTKQDIMSLKASKTKYVVSRGEDYSSPLFNIRGVCGHMVTQENEEELPLSPHLCLFKNMGTADGTQHNGTLTHSSALVTSGVAGSIGDDDQGGVYTNFVDSPMD